MCTHRTAMGTKQFPDTPWGRGMATRQKISATRTRVEGVPHVDDVCYYCQRNGHWKLTNGEETCPKWLQENAPADAYVCENRDQARSDAKATFLKVGGRTINLKWKAGAFSQALNDRHHQQEQDRCDILTSVKTNKTVDTAGRRLDYATGTYEPMLGSSPTSISRTPTSRCQPVGQVRSWRLRGTYAGA